MNRAGDRDLALDVLAGLDAVEAHIARLRAVAEDALLDSPEWLLGERVGQVERLREELVAMAASL